MPLQPAVLGPNTRLNNFRLNYLTADQAAERPTRIWILLDGIDITRPDAPIRVLYKSLSIRDVLFDAPNTCALTLYGAAAPHVGQPLEVWANSNAPQLLFNGELQTVEKTYKGRPTTVLHPVTGIDDTARANRRRPLRPYTNVSATTIAQDLIATYCPGFSSAGVEAGLPAVSINFDGSEGGMKGCLTALAKLIGGYWYFEAKTLYLFVTPPGTPPDPIDDTPGRFLHDPAITWTIDKSQVRTRVYGKGASTRMITTLAASEALVPIENGEMFTATGGQAIAGVTPDGAASRVLTYTSVQLGGGGSLVGAGAAPSAAPGVTVAPGAGVESGVHQYAVTFVTASGETLPGPIAAVTVGTMAAPAAAPVPGLPTVGGAVDAGSHTYAVTFVTAAGETTGSAASPSVTTAAGSAAPTPAPSPFGAHAGVMTNALDPNAYYAWVYTFLRSEDGAETLPSAPSAAFYNTVASVGGSAVPSSLLSAGATPPAGHALRWYRSQGSVVSGAAAQAGPFYRVTGGIVATGGGGTRFYDGTSDGSLGALAPTGNTTSVQTVPIAGIAIGPAGVTARKLYRSSGAGPYKLVTTIANNTATTYTDTAASASLGATLPAVNTAAANQVLVQFSAGGSAVTARKLYRTAAGQSTLKLLTTIANNTATSHTDAAADATLGAAPPLSDSSGLTQPSGQVPAGATTIPIANGLPFYSMGGWAVIGNGEQVIRYTTANYTNLTGIPASGPGSIVAAVAYNSTITAAPALMGVTGLVDPVIRNAPIHVWVQRDDLAAQANMAALDGGGDGVYEHIWSDERRSEASLRQVCDAQLALYSRPLVTVTYASRDLNTKSGKTVTIALATPAINESLTIQDVTITELGIKGLAPKFTVTASTARQSFEAILQMLIRKADS